MNRRNFFKNATTAIVTTATAGVAAKVAAEPVDEYANTKRYFEDTLKLAESRQLDASEITAFKKMLLVAPKELACVYVLKFIDNYSITEADRDFIGNDDKLVEYFTKVIKQS